MPNLILDPCNNKIYNNSQTIEIIMIDTKNDADIYYFNRERIVLYFIFAFRKYKESFTETK